MLSRGTHTLFYSMLVAGAVLLPGSLTAQPKLDALIVYGDGFVFSVKEPAGWRGDTRNAGQYSANVIFYPDLQSPGSASVVIRVLVADKTDEDIERDLDADMKEYRLRYPTVAFDAFPVTHPSYRVVSKLFRIHDRFYEYVSYLNPGPAKKLMFSVSMNSPGVPATRDEAQAYLAVAASLHML
jgi:hypothetical protein